jgi:hypothetical protein
LLHIALTAAALDLEAAIASGHHEDDFDIAAWALPSLTILALEEPENSLSPFYLSRVVQQLLDITDSGRSQAIMSSHSASIIKRVSPQQVRHFHLDENSRTTKVQEIPLPIGNSEAAKYIREAVQAYPELYFARFVVLVEGSSEQVVLPRLSEARGLHIDQSFVAIAPLGGRHTHHFWRLLTHLRIPFATLLDLDWGRAGGGEGRIRDVCRWLEAVGSNPFDGSPGIERYTLVKDIRQLPDDDVGMWLDHLEKWDVFFSEPLDLDWTLLKAYKSAYTEHLEGAATGPSSHGDPRDAVLGPKSSRISLNLWEAKEATEDLRWYRYLFLGRSKPSTHLAAFSRLDSGDLRTIPARLGRLLDRIEGVVSSG